MYVGEGNLRCHECKATERMVRLNSQGKSRCRKIVEERREEFDKRRHENGRLVDGEVMDNL
jgi:hypothetical protein